MGNLFKGGMWWVVGNEKSKRLSRITILSITVADIFQSYIGFMLYGPTIHINPLIKWGITFPVVGCEMLIAASI